MQLRRLGAVLLLAVTWLLLPRPHAALSAHVPVLNSQDKRVGGTASEIAGRSVHQALVWLSRRHRVASSAVGPDRQTIVIHFRDGAQVFILPRRVSPVRFSLNTRLHAYADQSAVQAGSSSGNAIVLEPFADELGLGPSAGQSEADILSAAGFHVEIFRNSAVTVGVMESLASYSAVYIETHSGLLPGGDLILETGDTATQPYASMFEEGSLGQGFVAGDSTRTLYTAIKSKFVALHVGQFPSSSLMFINGCSILVATQFWQVLQNHNVGTLIGWDNDVESVVTEPDAQAIFGMLATGETVKQSLDQAAAQGKAISEYNGTVVHLSFLGDGDNTLHGALIGATATPVSTATSVATATPAATSTPVPLTAHVKMQRSAVRIGQKQKITVNTVPGASVTIRVVYPNRKKVTHHTVASDVGTVTWSFKQSTTGRAMTRGTAHVTVKVTDLFGQTRQLHKSYSIT